MDTFWRAFFDTLFGVRVWIVAVGICGALVCICYRFGLIGEKPSKAVKPDDPSSHEK